MDLGVIGVAEGVLEAAYNGATNTASQ